MQNDKTIVTIFLLIYIEIVLVLAVFYCLKLQQLTSELQLYFKDQKLIIYYVFIRTNLPKCYHQRADFCKQ